MFNYNSIRFSYNKPKFLISFIELAINPVIKIDSNNY